MERIETKETLNKSFGDNLRKIRKGKEITQGDMADKAGLSLRYVQAIEAGEKTPSVHTLAKLCLALSISSETLISPMVESIRN